MAYTLDFALNLGAGKAGIVANLRAQLYDTTGTNSGAEISTGFAAIGTNGCYTWHYAAFPDDFRGGVKFYESGTPNTVLSVAAINPEEAEYTDEAVSVVGDAVENNLSFINIIINRLGTFTGSGVNTVLGVLRALASKTVSLPSDLTSGGLTYDNTTDALEAIRDRGDSAWVSGSITITPAVSTVSVGEVVSDDVLVYQYAGWEFTWTIVDQDGNAIDLSTDDLVFIVYDLEGDFYFQLTNETGGGITVGGAGNNQVTVTDDDSHTITPNAYRYVLRNTTTDRVLARGAFTVIPDSDSESSG